MFTNSLIPSIKNDVWADFSDIFDEFDHLMSSNRFDFSQSFPPMNVYLDQNDKGFFLEMSLVGYSKDYLNVEIDGSELKISAKVPEVKEDESKHYFKRRIQAKDFERKYKIPEGYDVSKTEVSFADGLLTVEIPAKEVVKNTVKRIAIR